MGGGQDRLGIEDKEEELARAFRNTAVSSAAFVNEIWPPCDTEIWPPCG
jgi:hypothetical protein